MVRDASTNRQGKGGSKAPVIALLVLGTVVIAFSYLIIAAMLFPQLVPPQVANLMPQRPASVEPEKTTSQTEEPDVMNLTLSQLFLAGSVQSVRLVGDSITAGYGTGGYVDHDIDRAGTVIYDDGQGDVHYESGHEAICWANEFRTYAQEHGVTDFVNAGINGSFMARLAQNPDAWLGNGADVVFVALGTNDAGYYGVDEFRQNATEGLANAAAACKVLVVLSPVSDYRPTSMLVEPATQLGEVLREICEQQGYVFVDTSQALTFEQFCSDGLHPNSEGSLAIWQCIVASLDLEG
ncbi:MAG: SGNH/GDSL hydrolase family protein [Coriobacteriales bacterium]|nr:SGNH/GDSL hydrolase family protein [Coriobacteriales bacterium]